MRPFFVASSLAACALVVACVGGSGNVPSEIIGPEGSASSAGSGSDVETSGSGDRGDDRADPPNRGGADEPPCVAGSACDCGQPGMLGVQTCEGGRARCECAVALPSNDGG